RDVLAAELRSLFGNIPLMGCTSAGEIGPSGYCDRSLAGVSFSSEICQAASGGIEDLHRFQITAGESLGKGLVNELTRKGGEVSEQNSFGFMLIDGLSMREEQVARAFQNALGRIPLAGGSAADGLNFGKTWVFSGGDFRRDAAALAVMTTKLPITVFKTQHFVPTEQRLVITEADPVHRLVKEINGFPAAQEYARVLAVEELELTPKRFAAFPVVVLIDGNNYVRSIQK